MTTTTTTAFRYLPIDDAVVNRVRDRLRDDHGNELHVQVSENGAPCRSCLRVVPAGARLILFAHRPFATHGPYAETGPVFVCADACAPYRGDEFPADFRPRILTLRAYDANGSIHDATLAAGTDADDMLARLFADPAVAFAHVRNPAWGCFDFAVERRAES